MLPLVEAVVRIEMQAMYSAVYLEKFALTETAVYSACFARNPAGNWVIRVFTSTYLEPLKVF
jgi:hypothetical protein